MCVVKKQSNQFECQFSHRHFKYLKRKVLMRVLRKPLNPSLAAFSAFNIFHQLALPIMSLVNGSALP